MALVSYFVCLYLFAIVTVSADVSLVPSGNVSVCASGAEISFTCVTDGSLLWITPTGNQLFAGLQSPTSEGRFYLVVNSAGPSISSTASLSNFQPEQDDGIFIRCREFTTGKEAEAVLRFAGAPNVILSKLNSTSVFISWNPSACVQYIITINSSDVYYNITTSDTNTTVTLSEFCVTVLGVDSINRTGPASEPQCYPPIITTSTITPSSNSNSASSRLSTTPSSPTPPVDQSSGVVSGGAIAGAVIAVIVIILAVLAAVAVIVFVYWKGKSRSVVVHVPPVAYTSVPKEYLFDCHTFCQGLTPNSWKVVFVFVPLEANFEALKEFYKDYQVYNSLSDCHLKSSGTIQVKVTDKPDKWTVHTSDDHQVHKADIEEYTGKCSPPHIEMLIIAASNKTTPPDLTVEAELKGVQKPNIIKFEKEAQNVVECVCQVFYHKEALNHWRARIAFFSKQHLKKVNQLYQDANNCSLFDVKFGGGVIKVSTDDTVIPAAGWKVTINQHYQKVTTAAVELYTGEGEPPYCEMTLRAADNADSHLIKQLVTLIGIREQPRNTFDVERALERSDGTLLYKFPPTLNNVNHPFVCQVFYHKLEGINHWKATLAFFTENKTDRVQQLHQDANLGLNFKVVKFININDGVKNDIAVIKPVITAGADGWNIQYRDKKMIRRKTLVEYSGVGKPPFFQMIFKAVSDVSTPPDLTATVIFGDVKKPTDTFTISRAAEIPPEVKAHEAVVHKADEKSSRSFVAAAVATAAVATVVTSGGSEKARFTKTENDVDDTGAYDDASAGDNHTKHTLPVIPGAEGQDHNSPTQYPKKPTTTTNHPNYDCLQYEVDYMGSK